MNEAFLDFYRCPVKFANFTAAADVGKEAGYFRFGDLICFGRCSAAPVSRSPRGELPDSVAGISFNDSGLVMPFDITDVCDNLRRERYAPRAHAGRLHAAVRDAYYLIRPAIGVPVRSRLQRIFLRGWESISFPHWPVDTTVDRLFESVMGLLLKLQGLEAVPFIWFWPDGASSCVTMTHDVETVAGARFCSTLMDMDETWGIKASFQIVPEERYPVSASLLDSIRQRGFEVNVQDLNHDGRLFWDRGEFLRRAEAINRYAKDFGARGFRSAAMYRNLEWFDALEFSYDLSIPNAAHLEPQRGGCCTVFPYFIGNILEIPLTTTQDYSIFHIIGQYSTDLWKRQIALLQEQHGLVSFIVHPDYVIPERARNTYRELLEHLAEVRATRQAWFALPHEVDAWWRARNRMELVEEEGRWVVRGPDCDRARVAFAIREGDRLVYQISTEATTPCRA